MTSTTAVERRPVAAILFGLLGWFAVQLYDDGTQVGLTERLLAGAQALWPLGVALSSRAAPRA